MNTPSVPGRLLWPACALLLAAAPATAQPVSGPPAASAGALAAPVPTTEAPVAPPETVRGFVAVEFVDARGYPVRPGDFRATTVQNYIGAVTLHLGPAWTAAAAAQRSYYSDPTFHDATSGSVALVGVLGSARARWQLAHESSVTELPLSETASQVRERTHRSTLDGDFETDSPWRISFQAAQQVRFAEFAPTVREWSAQTHFGYRLSPHWEIGPALLTSFAEITPGADLGAWSPQLALKWTPRSTVQFALQGGPDYRAFHGAATTRFHRTVYGAQLDWRPRSTVEWRLHVNRELGVSYFTDLFTLRRGEGFEWRQQLNATLRAYLCHERHRTDYLRPDSDLSERIDHSRTSIAGLAWLPRRHTTVELFYRRTANESTAPGHSFVSEQWSLRLTCTL